MLDQATPHGRLEVTDMYLSYTVCSGVNVGVALAKISYLIEGEGSLFEQGDFARDLQCRGALRIHHSHQLIRTHLVVQPPPHRQLHLLHTASPTSDPKLPCSRCEQYLQAQLPSPGHFAGTRHMVRLAIWWGYLLAELPCCEVHLNLRIRHVSTMVDRQWGLVGEIEMTSCEDDKTGPPTWEMTASAACCACSALLQTLHSFARCTSRMGWPSASLPCH